MSSSVRVVVIESVRQPAGKGDAPSGERVAQVAGPNGERVAAASGERVAHVAQVAGPSGERVTAASGERVAQVAGPMPES